MSKIAKIFGAKKPRAPEPLPPLPTRKDPAIEDARKRQASADRMRKGRRSTILTSGRGVDDELGNVARPAAKLLGG